MRFWINIKLLMRKLNGTDVEVTKEDQQRINSFSKFFQKKQEL